MNKQESQARQLYLGVDGGGSKCRVVIVDPNVGEIASAVSGPANVLRGVEQAIQHIIQATDEALAQLGMGPSTKSDLIAGIGLAGLNLDSCMREIQTWQHPFKQAYFTSDLHIACFGAHAGQDGAVMIIGTGSSALLSKGNQIVEFGGHGFPAGDGGSGAWLGLRAVDATLRALDGVAQASPMTQLVASHYQVQSAIDLAQQVAHFAPADYAKLAPMVMSQAQQQDPVARVIVQQGCDYLTSLATRLMSQGEVPLALIGGLAHLVSAQFPADIKAQLVPAKHPPELGAVLFAQHHSEQAMQQKLG